MRTIRPVRDNDLAYFAKWWRDPDLISVTSGNTSPLLDNDVKKYFNDLKTTSSAFHFMIQVGNQTIGHISLQKRNDDWWETQIVIGEKEMQNKGYGTQTVSLLIDVARKHGIEKIYLEVRPDNTKAIHAYDKAGFKQVGGEVPTGNKHQPSVLRMEYLQNK